MKRVDIAGKQFGKLTAIRAVGMRGGYLSWLFRCECGKERELPCKNVIYVSSKQKSCGCLKESKREPLYGTKFYMTFHLLKQRCNNKKCPRYHRWGGRGIKCLWKSFSEFKSDMYESFLAHEAVHGGRNTSIDRIDNDGNYCKENCRWATAKEQMLNTSVNVHKH